MAASNNVSARDLPPGPRLPRAVQTAGFLLFGPRFMDACRRRYGDAVTFSTLFDSRFVMLFEPSLVKQLFQGSGERLHAGEANALLGPVLGERSVLLLDGAEHLRHRRLMLPSFHGRRMQGYGDVMRESADLEIESWPVGEPFPLLGSMQSLTLRVILRAVFGYEQGAAEDELSQSLRAMIEPLARPRGLLLLQALGRFGRETGAAARRFEANRRAVDKILLAEIARRREDPELENRDDVFSALLLARDESGQQLSDGEVRDELVTLLLAGHETTATGLAWTFDLLLHSPAVMARALGRSGADARAAAANDAEADAEGDADVEGDADGEADADGAEADRVAYLDAVVKEALRIRPVIPGVGRVVRGEPFQLNGYTIPEGVEINPSIRMIHRRGDIYPDPASFRPERFLGEDAPDTYTWVPFGGGTRRCIGASFALMEMRIVLERVLARASLRAAEPKLDDVQFRGITLAPRHGVRVVLERPPAPRA